MSITLRLFLMITLLTIAGALGIAQPQRSNWNGEWRLGKSRASNGAPTQRVTINACNGAAFWCHPAPATARTLHSMSMRT